MPTNLSFPPPFGRSQQHQHVELSPDAPVIATNSDAAISKASCVRAGYYSDDFLKHFVGVDGSSSSTTSTSSAALSPKRPPLINRGACLFLLSLLSPPSLLLRQITYVKISKAPKKTHQATSAATLPSPASSPTSSRVPRRRRGAHLPPLLPLLPLAPRSSASGPGRTLCSSGFTLLAKRLIFTWSSTFRR